MVTSVVIEKIVGMKVGVAMKPDHGLVTSLTFDTKCPPPELARLLNMWQRDPELILSVTSHQLEMDLAFSPVEKQPVRA